MSDRTPIFVSLREALLLSAAVLLLSACPGPGPEPVDPPVDPRSEERKQFESGAVEGMYRNGTCVLPFSDSEFQKSVSRSRLSYRIQSDNQEKYMHMDFVKVFPARLDDGVECTVRYNLGDNSPTVLVIKFIVVKVSDGYLYLWNEIQKVGVILPQ